MFVEPRCVGLQESAYKFTILNVGGEVLDRLNDPNSAPRKRAYGLAVKFRLTFKLSIEQKR